MSKTFALTALTISFTLSMVASASFVNPVENSSFEIDNNTDNIPDDWFTSVTAGNAANTSFVYVQNASDAFEGDDYVSIDNINNANGEYSWRQVVDPLTGITPGPAGTELKIRIAYRYENFDGNDQIRIRLRPRDAGNANLGDIDFDISITGTGTNWTVFESDAFTLPVGTVEIDPLAIFMRGGGNGFGNGQPGLTSMDLDAVEIIPEPGSVSLLALGAVLILGRRRR